MRMKDKWNVWKTAAFVLFAVSVVISSAIKTKADIVYYVSVGDFMYYIDTDKHIAGVTAYIGSDTEVEIPESFVGDGVTYTVTEINTGAFASETQITSVKIPNTVTDVEEKAFEGCTALEEITLSDNLTFLGEAAFKECESLKCIEVPKGVTVLEPGVFNLCPVLEEVVLHEGLQSIGRGAFKGCYALKKIELPGTLKTIESSAFWACGKLENLTIPAGVTQIESAVFGRCVSLKQMEIPDGVSEIGSHLFWGCTGLEEVVIPNSVKTIANEVFYNCYALTQVVIPESVESIQTNTFTNCVNLEIIFYPSNLKDVLLSDAYENVAQISYVINPDGTISLTVENLPEGMTDIELPADIGGRKITSITGPEGVQLSVSCANHYTKKYTKSADNHQYTCVLCKKSVKEAHSYEKGSQPCVCGYVPFAITAQPASMQLAYPNKEAVISVTAKATFGTEKVTYQWQEDGKAISGATAASYAILSGKPVGSYTYTCKLTSGGYSQVTKAVTVTVKPPVKGKKYKDDANMATYKVTKARTDGKGTVEYMKPVSKKKATVIIPATVEIGGVTYKVTAIAKNAFKGNKNLKRLTIEKNVGKIGANAFSGCKKLKNITIKTTKLTTKKIGANAFKNIKSNATIKVPKKKVKAYKSMLKKKGVSTKAKIRKM